MDWFTSAIEMLQYGAIGFIGLLTALVVFGMIFGTRIDRKWKYEAEFRDAKRREFGEFEIKLWRVHGSEEDYQLRVSFYLRHPELVPGSTVSVHLDEVLVLEGMVEQAGRVRLGKEHLKADIKDPEAGQICSVRCGDVELCATALRPD